MDTVTEMRCPEMPRGDNSSHHLVPRGDEMRCAGCHQSEAQLREHGGMVKRTQDELVAEMIRRFGPDQQAWAFQCPACGDVAVSADFKAEFERRGMDRFGSDAVGQDCIGRWVEGRGCDWAAYGLFSGPEFVILPDGRDAPCFPIAPGVLP